MSKPNPTVTITELDRLLTDSAVLRSSVAVSRLFDNPSGLSEEEEQEWLNPAPLRDPDWFSDENPCGCDRIPHIWNPNNGRAPYETNFTECYLSYIRENLAEWASPYVSPYVSDTPNNRDVLSSDLPNPGGYRLSPRQL